MIFGTHNSATGGKLVWWLKPLAWIINPTSKCQDRSIKDQLADGVRVFNLQITFVNNKWRFSHGLALYNEDVTETIALLKACASPQDPVYIQLYLDNCFWCKQDVDEFEWLLNWIKRDLCGNGFNILSAWVEGTDYYPYKGSKKISLSEHYWTMSWAKNNKKSWIDLLPLPRRHARKYNSKYKKENKSKYLMLDFYEK